MTRPATGCSIECISKMFDLSEDTILGDFDRHHRKGTIHYDHHPEITRRTVQGFEFEFAVTGSLSKKPYIKDNSDEPPYEVPILSSVSATVSTVINGSSNGCTMEYIQQQQQQQQSLQRRRSGCVPGSDIDISDYEISEVNGTHNLAFNKFCMYRPHLLLLTKDGYRRQYEHLDLADFSAAWGVLQALRWRYFVFFNCGKDGGCSRLHKHLQLTPYAPGRLQPWAAANKPLKVPYRHVLRRFEVTSSPERLLALYEDMMVEAHSILKLGSDTNMDPDAPATTSVPASTSVMQPRSYHHHVPHNVILGRDWILVIPRRKAGLGGAYANALGMLGMVSVASQKELDAWIEQGPLEILSDIGVAKDA